MELDPCGEGGEGERAGRSGGGDLCKMEGEKLDKVQEEMLVKKEEEKLEEVEEEKLDNVKREAMGGGLIQERIKKTLLLMDSHVKSINARKIERIVRATE